MLPSQFLDVVLEENPDDREASDREKRCDAVESQKVVRPKGHDAVGRAATTATAINNNNNNNINNNRILFEGWDLGKKLPEALLAECTVEICTNPKQKKETPKLRFEARVTPIYKKNDKKKSFPLARRREGDDGGSDPDRASYPGGGGGPDDAHEDVMLSEVEAVYSEHDSDSEMGASGGPDATATTTLQQQQQHKRLPPPPPPQPQQQQQFVSPSFRCEHCPNTYGNRGALWQHCLAAHSPRKNCECGICGRRFYRNCSLALHLKSHESDAAAGVGGGVSGGGGVAPVSTCPDCGKEFTKASTLDKHIRATHLPTLDEPTPGGETSPPPAHSVVCPQCPKSFSSAERLEQHLRLGHRYLPPAVLRAITPPGAALVCPSCCLRFYSAAELTRHEAVCAPRGRPYQCQYCKKCYSQKSVLKKHLVIHTGERLTCALCGIDFTQKSSLLRHVKRMHTAAAAAPGGYAAVSAAAAGYPPTVVHKAEQTTEVDALPNVQSFISNIKIPQGISISMVD